MLSIETTMALRQETPGNEGWMRSARAGDPNKYFVVSAVCHAKRSGRVRKMIPIWMLVLSLSFAAWADPGSDAGTSDEGPRILEFYYGLDMLPSLASLLCMTNVAGQDGAPVTFSVQLDGASVAPSDFIVETATGERVTPDCATLRPADEVLELRTVLLTGTFGTPDSQPRAVEVVGVLQELNGAEFGGPTSSWPSAIYPTTPESAASAHRTLRRSSSLSGEAVLVVPLGPLWGSRSAWAFPSNSKTGPRHRMP
jgi:hypothetical protein